MKVNPGPNAPKSSFGIPAEMKEAVAQQRAQKEIDEDEAKGDARNAAGPEMSHDEGYESEESSSDEDALPEGMDPAKSLDDLGIEITEDDLHNLLFKGYIEKEVDVVKSPKKTMTAVFKTLTGEEMQVADMLLASDAESLKMTQPGFESRRSLWILSFGVIKLAGKEISVIYLDDKKEIMLEKTARERNKILHKLSPMLLDKMAKIHARMTMACNYIMDDPTSPLLKRPSEAQKA